MVKVPGVADCQQDDANVSVTGGESERCIHSARMALLVYRIRTNNTLLTDQLTTQRGQQGRGRRTSEEILPKLQGPLRMINSPFRWEGN